MDDRQLVARLLEIGVAAFQTSRASYADPSADAHLKLERRLLRPGLRNWEGTVLLATSSRISQEQVQGSVTKSLKKLYVYGQINQLLSDSSIK